MKRYKIDAKAAWHVHVGGGDDHKLNPLDYVVKESVKDGKAYFYRIDVGEMMKNDSHFADEFTRIVERDDSIHYLRKMIYDNFNPEKKNTWIHRADVTGGFLNEYKKNLNDTLLNNQLIVNCMPMNSGKVYIPGSSIKGSIRTAVLDSLARKEGYENVYNEVKRKMKENQNKYKRDNKNGGNKNDKIESDKVEKQLLGYNRMENDPFKAVKVTDAILPQNSTVIVVVKNVGKDKIGETKESDGGIAMYMEMVKPGTEFEFRISIEDKAGMNGIDIHKHGLTIDRLMKRCTNYYSIAIGEEADKFYEYDSEADIMVQNTFNEMLDDNEEPIPGMSIIRLGRFSHLESITYNHRGPGKLCQPSPPFDKRTGKRKPWGTTRNLVECKYPCGAVVLTYREE